MYFDVKLKPDDTMSIEWKFEDGIPCLLCLAWAIRPNGMPSWLKGWNPAFRKANGETPVKLPLELAVLVQTWRQTADHEDGVIAGAVADWINDRPELITSLPYLTHRKERCALTKMLIAMRLNALHFNWATANRFANTKVKPMSVCEAYSANLF